MYENRIKSVKDVVRRNIRTENSIKHSNTSAKADSKAAGDTESESGSSSMSLGESQAYSKTKVKTKISASSNAKSNSSAAAKAKAFAKTNTETKVKTNQGNQQGGNKTPKPPPTKSTTEIVPYPSHKGQTTTPQPFTRPTHAFWSPSFGSTVTPTPAGNNGSEVEYSKVTAPPAPETKIICVNCPVPCPYPIQCPCSCPVQPANPTIVFCPSPCQQPYPVYITPPAPKIIQVVAQPAVYTPCTVLNQPCYTPPPTSCNCAQDINCLCKRTVGDKPQNDTDSTEGRLVNHIFYEFRI